MQIRLLDVLSVNQIGPLYKLMPRHGNQTLSNQSGIRNIYIFFYYTSITTSRWQSSLFNYSHDQAEVGMEGSSNWDQQQQHRPQVIAVMHDLSVKETGRGYCDEKYHDCTNADVNPPHLGFHDYGQQQRYIFDPSGPCPPYLSHFPFMA